MTVMAPTPRLGRAPWWARCAAGVGLAVAVAVSPLPLRWQLAAVRLTAVLPDASHQQVCVLHRAVEDARPRWWRGRLACLEVQIATVFACALIGRRVRLVFGARFLGDEAHAWLRTPDGDVGLGEDAGDRPWTAALVVPAPHRRAPSAHT